MYGEQLHPSRALLCVLKGGQEKSYLSFTTSWTLPLLKVLHLWGAKRLPRMQHKSTQCDCVKAWNMSASSPPTSSVCPYPWLHPLPKMVIHHEQSAVFLASSWVQLLSKLYKTTFYSLRLSYFPSDTSLLMSSRFPCQVQIWLVTP